MKKKKKKYVADSEKLVCCVEDKNGITIALRPRVYLKLDDAPKEDREEAIMEMLEAVANCHRKK
jgi:hypothetical protein